MTNLWVVDSIDHNNANLVCDNGQKMQVPLSSLPHHTKEESVLKRTGNIFILLENVTEERTKAAQQRLDTLFSKNAK